MVARAVDMTFEGHAFFGQLAQVRQAHHLKPARVRQDGFIPIHELMQATQTVDPFCRRTQHQMVGVPQQDIRTCRGHAFRHHRLDRGSGANRHERRRANIAARRADDACSCFAVSSIK